MDIRYLTFILVRAMAEFPDASFGQLDPPPSEGEKRLHEDCATVVQFIIIMTVVNNDTLSVFSIIVAKWLKHLLDCQSKDHRFRSHQLLQEKKQKHLSPLGTQPRPK